MVADIVKTSVLTHQSVMLSDYMVEAVLLCLQSLVRSVVTDQQLLPIKTHWVDASEP